MKKSELNLEQLKLMSEILEIDNKKELLKTFTQDSELEYIFFKQKGFLVYKNLGISYDIYYISVLKEFRNQGIGYRLLDEISKKDLILEVNIKNIKAINLYQKFGFKKIKEIKNYYNKTDSAIVMVKKN